MRKEIAEHHEKSAQRQAKLSEFAHSIRENEKTLEEKQQAYKASVAAGNDAETDSLFHEVETLQGRIKADKHKYGTLQEVTEEFLKADALKVVQGYPFTVKAEHEKKAKAALQKVEEAKQAYIQELSIVDGLDADFATDTQEYFSLIDRYDLTKREVNTGYNNLLYTIENPRPLVPDKSSLGIDGNDITDYYKLAQDQQRALRKEQRKNAVKQKLGVN